MASPEEPPPGDETPAQASDEAAVSEAPAPVEAYRPPFARNYPRDPDLDRLLAAFVAGNYALVREEAEDLAARADDPQVARAAHDLRRRIEADPMAVAMLGGAAFLLLFLVLWFYTHRHGH